MLAKRHTHSFLFNAQLLQLNTLEDRFFGPIATSCVKSRLRHFAIVFTFNPYCKANAWVEACDRCSPALVMYVVLALSCNTCPIKPPWLTDHYTQHQHTVGLNS